MNFRKKSPVDLEALDRQMANDPVLSLPKGRPDDFAPPAIRAATAAHDVAVNPQVMSRAGELLQQAHKALADQVRKACADEVEHAMELQRMGEQVAQKLEENGKDLAIALSAQNSTVVAMFDEQKKFTARKQSLKDQIVANGIAEPEIKTEAEMMRDADAAHFAKTQTD